MQQSTSSSLRTLYPYLPRSRVCSYFAYYHSLLLLHWKPLAPVPGEAEKKEKEVVVEPLLVPNLFLLCLSKASALSCRHHRYHHIKLSIVFHRLTHNNTKVSSSRRKRLLGCTRTGESPPVSFIVAVWHACKKAWFNNKSLKKNFSTNHTNSSVKTHVCCLITYIAKEERQQKHDTLSCNKSNSTTELHIWVQADD